jgi:hypothetical protein
MLRGTDPRIFAAARDEAGRRTGLAVITKDDDFVLTSR